MLQREKRSRMGRPPKRSFEKKNRQVSIAMTSAEMKLIRAEAEKAGMSISELLMRPWRKSGKEE